MFNENKYNQTSDSGQLKEPLTTHPFPLKGGGGGGECARCQMNVWLWSAKNVVFLCCILGKAQNFNCAFFHPEEHNAYI